MAFMMQLEGIEQARVCCERALRVINFTNAEDKLNLWTAFMNLENNFGTEETLIK